MKKKYVLSALLGLGLGWTLISPVHADDAAVTDGSAAASQPDLDQRVSALEQRLAELTPVSGSAAIQNSGAYSYANALRGIGFSNADGTYGIQFSGTLQEDARNYIYDGLTAPNSNGAKGATDGLTQEPVNEFVLARARLLVDGYLGPRVHLRYQEDFSNNGTNSGVLGSGSTTTGGNGAILVDAYGELKLLPWTLLRVGQFKAPLDIERWRLTPAEDFIQYSYTAGLTVDRVQGALIEIADPKQVIYLSGGAIDGDTDSGSTPVVQAYNSNKDAVAKLFVQPFNALEQNPLGDLGFGVAGTAGNHSGAPELGYKSLGQEAIVAPTSGNILSTYTEGAGYRLAPQAYWFFHNVSLLGEYVHESDNYRINDALEQNKIADTEAWNAQAAWVITGEHTSYNGIKLDKDSFAWGALELVGRVEGAEYDEGALTGYTLGATGDKVNTAAEGLLDPEASVTALKSFSLGLNYIPVNDVEFLLDWDQTSFTNGGVNDYYNAAGKVTGLGTIANRPTEQTVQVRVQYAF
jgi:hypothetical protein